MGQGTGAGELGRLTGKFISPVKFMSGTGLSGSFLSFRILAVSL